MELRKITPFQGAGYRVMMMLVSMMEKQEVEMKREDELSFRLLEFEISNI